MRVITKYWSDLLNKEFTSECALHEAEKDYNDKMTAQKLAEQERQAKKAALKQAEANLKKAQAEYEAAARAYMGDDTYKACEKAADAMVKTALGIRTFDENDFERAIQSLFR